MGYSGLRNWQCGDSSSSNTTTFIENTTKMLKSALRDAGNEFNPSGAVNVGLFTEAFLKPIAKQLSFADTDDEKGLLPILKHAREKLVKEIKQGEKNTAENWGGYDNKRMHLRAYNRILKNLNETIQVIDTHAEKMMHQTCQRLIARRKPKKNA